MAKKEKKLTEKDIKLEVAKSKSENLKRKVEDVYRLKDDSSVLKHDLVWNLVSSGVLGTLSILSAIDIIKTRNTAARAFLAAWWIGCAIEEGYSAHRVNKRKKDLDSDIVVLEDDIFKEAGITLGK